jgi:hypothetical protein
MIKYFNIIILLVSTLLFYSCLNKENETETQQDKTIETKYTYRPFRTTYPSESFINELDSSKWILKSFRINPSGKFHFDLSSQDSLFFYRASNELQKDIYIFKPSKSIIFKNEKKIGSIFMEKIEFDTLTDPNGNKMGTRFRTILNVDQPNDSIMNGRFNIGYHKNDRLFLELIRTDNATKKEEFFQLIFYKLK